MLNLGQVTQIVWVMFCLGHPALKKKYLGLTHKQHEIKKYKIWKWANADVRSS